jgi:YVTN family beta-propeller protein
MYQIKNLLLLTLSVAALVACRSTMGYQSTVVADKSYHSSYDDTTMMTDNGLVMMPFNRVINPAGTVMKFGNPSLENHSLDCALLPGGRILAVEDRYGMALIDVQQKKLLSHVDYNGKYKGLMSTYSGIKALETGNVVHIYWGASNPSVKSSFILDAVWDGKKASITDAIDFKPVAPSPMALPNDIAINNEGGENFMYVVLNGNSRLSKIRLSDRKEMWSTETGMAPFGIVLVGEKAYVNNWAGPVPTDMTKETAGVPYGAVYIDPRTGATARGTVSVMDLQTGKTLSEIEVGLHPNAIISSADGKFVYVANGNSDEVSVISTGSDQVVETLSVRLRGEENTYIGDSPNALAIDKSGTKLFVSNGMDNAVAVIGLGEKASASGQGVTAIEGFIPTEAYPAGLVLTDNALIVANLEGEGARVKTDKGYTVHQQEATVSFIDLPDRSTLSGYTSRVEAANMLFRTKLTQRLPRKGVAPKPVPERIGEPSVFQHVVYIIKENKTYDQVMGDAVAGNGAKELCVFGEAVTPNQHKLAKEFMLLDNYYASGKCSGEGHSWADAAIVTDYVEKNVRAWFRSYPHVLADALVYNKEGFIWNNALDHGKTVRIYGEACTLKWKGSKNWETNWNDFQAGKPAMFENETTISRVRPILAPGYPGFDGQNVPDQMRAAAFIKELKEYEKQPGDQLPNLIVMALPADHTVGTKEGNPTPQAMVADNDLALGQIIEALTKSKFWSSTVVFVTEDDSQSGWDHVSAYRTTGLVVSPYSHLQKTVHTNYNQTCMVRTIEQILGIPPMNVIDATALPMYDCFTTLPDPSAYVKLKNRVSLTEKNKSVAELSGKAKKFALLSATPQFEHIDGGNDDLLNRILWYATKGNVAYPKAMTLPKKERVDGDD